MEVRIIKDRQLWNDFVASSQYCNIMQSYEWGELASSIGAEEVMRIGVVDADGKLCAAMLTEITSIPMLNQAYFYAPRGPIIDDPTSPALTMLLNFIKAEAHRRHAFMLKLEPGVPDDNKAWLAALNQRGFRINPNHMNVRNEWVLDIRPDEKTLLASMKEKWRYNIRLAGRKGVTVRRGAGPADIDAFYHLYRTTSERDFFAINQKSFYEAVLRLFEVENHAALFLAEYEGQAISAMIVITLGTWSWYMYGASANEQREKMPNHLLQWTAIQWAKAQGCHYYNFRGIPEILEEGQEMWGIYLFKRGFGGSAIHFLPTQDLVYQPLIYMAYRKLLDVKHWRDMRRQKRIVTQVAHPVSSV